MDGWRKAYAGLLVEARARWSQRSSRERQLLQLAALLLALWLAWSALLQPALRIRRQAPAEIAALQAQLGQAHAQVQQLAALRQLPAAAAASSDLLAASSGWLKAHQQAAPAQPLPAGVRLPLRDLPAAQWLELCATARRDWGAELGAVDLQVDAAQRLSGSVDLLQHASRQP